MSIVVWMMMKIYMLLKFIEWDEQVLKISENIEVLLGEEHISHGYI